MKMMTKFIALGFILSISMFFNHSEISIDSSETPFFNTPIKKDYNTPIEINKESFSYNNPFIFIENSTEPKVLKKVTKKNTLIAIITFTTKRFFNYYINKFPILKKLLSIIR